MTTMNPDDFDNRQKNRPVAVQASSGLGILGRLALRNRGFAGDGEEYQENCDRL